MKTKIPSKWFLDPGRTEAQAALSTELRAIRALASRAIDAYPDDEALVNALVSIKAEEEITAFVAHLLTALPEYRNIIGSPNTKPCSPTQFTTCIEEAKTKIIRQPISLRNRVNALNFARFRLLCQITVDEGN